MTSAAPSASRTSATRVRVPDGSTTTSSPALSAPAARRPAAQRAPSSPRSTSWIGSRAPCTAGGSTGTVSRRSSSGRPSYQGMFAERLDDVVALERADRDEVGLAQADRGAELDHVAHDLVEAPLVVVDEVHLVDGDDHVLDLEQRGDRGVPAALLGQPGAGVDQQQRQVGGGGARDHVARVLRVAGAVGEDEPPPRRRERAVGDVDRDALLALGPQAVGEQREVQPVDRALLHVGELVGEDGLGVVQKPADERRLAVVDAAGRGQPQQIHG